MATETTDRSLCYVETVTRDGTDEVVVHLARTLGKMDGSRLDAMLCGLTVPTEMARRVAFVQTSGHTSCIERATCPDCVAEQDRLNAVAAERKEAKWIVPTGS